MVEVLVVGEGNGERLLAGGGGGNDEVSNGGGGIMEEDILQCILSDDN